MAASVYRLHSTDEDPEKILAEMDVAEYNFNIISETASIMIKRSLLFYELKDPPGMIKPLIDLVTQLKLAFSFIRRDIQAANPRLSLGSPNVASQTARKPNIRPNDFKAQQTLCPLVLFLRIIARGLNAYHIAIPANDWGPVRPLRDLLKDLQRRIKYLPSKNSLYWPGLATCIMFHEHNSVFTITSSTPRYQYLQGLASLAKTVRKDHMVRLAAKADPEDREAIARVKQYCREIQKNNALQQHTNRIRLEGVGATFTPGAAYMAACFLDFWRFDMRRPLKAEADEARLQLSERPVYGFDSCAEWEMWITKISKIPIRMAELRKHPGVEVRQTYPVQNQHPKPPASHSGRRNNTASPRAPHWVPPPRRQDPNDLKSKEEDHTSGCCCILM